MWNILGWLISIVAVISIFHSVIWMNHLLGIFSIVYLTRKYKEIDMRSRLNCGLFIFLLSLLVSTLYNYEMVGFDAINIWSRIFKLYLVYIVLTVQLSYKNNLIIFIKLIKFIGILFIALGFIEVFFFDFTFVEEFFLSIRERNGIAHLFNANGVPRLLSVCNKFDPNFVGLLLSFYSTFYFSNFLFNRNKSKNFLFFLIFLAGVFLTGSRGALLVGVSSIIILLIFYCKKFKNIKTKKFLSILITVLIVCFGVISLNDNNIMFAKIEKMIDLGNYNKGTSDGMRIEMIDASMHILLDKPIIGLGIGGFNANIRNDDYISREHPALVKNDFLDPHNEFLTLWIESGIVGVILIFSIYFYNFRKILKQNKLDNEIILLGLSFTIIMIMNIPFEYALTTDRVMFMFLGFILIYFSDKLYYGK